MAPQSQESDGFIEPNSTDVVNFDDLEKLPYLKHIEMIKLTPRHFNLDSWTRLFVIPDYIMRRVYRGDVWIDTGLPGKACEQLTPEQKQMLTRWLKEDSPFRYELTAPQIEERLTQDRDYEEDDLKDLLSKSEDWLQLTEHDCDQREPKIATCTGHSIQAESAIVERAINRMDHLSEGEEQEFQKLIQDKEYMNFLNETIRRYLDNCG